MHELLGRLARGTVVRDHLEREHRAVVRDADRRDRDDVALLREDGGDLDLRAQLVGFRDGIRGLRDDEQRPVLPRAELLGHRLIRAVLRTVDGLARPVRQREAHRQRGNRDSRRSRRPRAGSRASC
ncbi:MULTISPECIES: hypothetical protein [Microbacterium]|uniref:hypothetical protein n=1 Tax=Microbacterium TaxID=33882 RepID=UPI001EF46445|nr:hypothetical protein [Microbacterium aurum]MCG7414872.1 hypothetical protein [Microbacterium aurum]